MKKLSFFLMVSISFIVTISGQEFSRVIELKNPRMNGPDVKALQERLLFLGFSTVGEADGYYGPMTESAVVTINRYLGFCEEKDYGSYTERIEIKTVRRQLWNILFSKNYERILRIISVVSSYDHDKLSEYGYMTKPSPADENFVRGSIYSDGNVIKIISKYWQISYFPYVVTYIFFNENILFVFLDVRRLEGIIGTEVHYQDETGTFRLTNGIFEKLNDIHYDYRDILLHADDLWRF
jgi:hypothetical protein